MLKHKILESFEFLCKEYGFQKEETDLNSGTHRVEYTKKSSIAITSEQKKKYFFVDFFVNMDGKMFKDNIFNYVDVDESDFIERVNALYKRGRGLFPDKTANDEIIDLYSQLFRELMKSTELFN